MTMTREEAIKKLQKQKAEYLDEWVDYSGVAEAFDMATEALSAEAEQGEWIDVNGDGSLWRCDQCKDTACCKGNFCPNCGARMNKGGENE